MNHKTQKNDLNLKLTTDYNCAYIFISITAVLIIFCVILQTFINLIMLSIGGQGEWITSYAP